MAVTSNLTDISMCETTTNWAVSGGPNLAVEDQTVIEGTYSLSGDVDIETGVYLYDYYTANANTAIDMTDKHLFIWALVTTATFLDSHTNGGIRLVMEDGSGNQGYWYVGGNDTYAGGWKRFLIDGNSTPTANNGTNPTLTNIYKMGIAFKATAKSKATTNVFFDCMQYGSSAGAAITVTGGTSGTPLTWEDVLTGDQGLAKQAGVIRKVGGVYFLQAPILFGDTGTGDTYFKDTSKIVVWEDTLAAVDYYDITVTGNATGATSFELGSVSGTGIDRFGSGGGVMTAAGAHKWTVDAETNTANIDAFNLYGASFLNSGIIKLSGATTQEAIGCTFDKCGQVQPNESEILNCNFLNCIETTGAVEMLNTDDDNITYCLFRNCDNGVYFPSGQTASRDFVALDFDDVSGNFDINNASGSTVIANQITGSNANSYTGSTVTINNSVTLTVQVIDKNKNNIQDAQTSIHLLDSPYTELMNEDTLSTGIATEAYNYGGDVDIVIKVRKSDNLDSPRYKRFSTTGKITTNGYTLTVTLIEQPLPI